LATAPPRAQAAVELACLRPGRGCRAAAHPAPLVCLAAAGAALRSRALGLGPAVGHSLAPRRSREAAQQSGAAQRQALQHACHPTQSVSKGLRVIAAQSATSLCSCTIVHLPQTGVRQAPVQPPQASTVWTALPRQRAVVPGAGRGAHVLQAAASQEVARHVRLGLPGVSGVSEDRQTSRESMTRKLAAHFTFVFARQRTCQEVGIQPW